MFKTLQVLRLTKNVRNTKGRVVVTGSRVVVVNVKDGVVKARYGTNKNDYQYLNAPVTAFATAIKGRPVGTGKKNTDVPAMSQAQ